MHLSREFHELPSEDDYHTYTMASSQVPLLRSDSDLEGNRLKVINDPIHGHIFLSKDIVAAVDTPQFQRLRDLKQLGVSYFVFPGASHNRFEHCIGVSHLAGKMLDRLRVVQPELEITQREVDLVRMGGLCHDLGHGPFSHAFEEWVHKYKNPNFHHEDMSIKMLNYMIDDNHLEYDEHERKFLSDVIRGFKQPGHKKERGFLYEIVANGRNSIDVDKFDYLARDCYNLNLKSSYDSSRLMHFCRVVNDEICFHSKEAYNLYEMFHTRYSLHKQVYGHRVAKAIEYMVSDALAAADGFLHISSALDDPIEYIHLTDSILRTIESSKAEQLKDARDIVRRIRKRELYKFVDEVIVPKEKWDILTKKLNFEMEVTTNQEQGAGLRPDDIIVQQTYFNYAMKNRNPVDSVRFFSRYDSRTSFQIPKETVSLLIPDVFEEKILRIFVRDKNKSGAAQTAFRNFLRKNGLNSDLFSKAYLSPHKSNSGNEHSSSSGNSHLAPPASKPRLTRNDSLNSLSNLTPPATGSSANYSASTTPTKPFEENNNDAKNGSSRKTILPPSPETNRDGGDGNQNRKKTKK